MPVTSRKGLIYTVKSGDTLFAIASRFGSTTTGIERANHLYPPVTDRGLIYPDDVLIVPTSTLDPIMTHIVTNGDTLTAIAQTFGTHVDLLAGVNNIPDPNIIGVGQRLLVPAFTYKITTGDTLYSIARRFGVRVTDLEEANADRPGFQRDVIWPGYHLIIPIPTSRNIFVTRPLPGSTINSGDMVEGYARVFEAVVNYQLRDSNGVVVSNERYAMTDKGAPEYGFFSSAIPFDRQPTADSGELWVYSRSAKDGSIQDLVKIKVYF
ncbi:LysM peptidoglycan-binding domain-containing protein [Halobacillus halophilus]|uniref:LysM peptidoglycan-binding domain-containing protein n=1 Tax=Halobacillus halophilus TaxID=1570 RepID=UPI001CD639DD|nr:Gmad2 immunoglobulin-like domain-containing protein [Halobacillus halophilus]MCA1011534.1 LysM peptidoglycan-binding domain-containing protein [Halobacillus halophilus]